MKSILLLFAILSLHSLVLAQELNIRVAVQAAPGFPGDQSALKQLEQDLTRYINDRKWTNDDFLPEEKINGTLTFIVEKRPTPDQFEGSVQVQCFRPVFNSTYETIVLNFTDRDGNFKYITQQALDYSENSYISNLTSLVNFYMFMVLGFDYDSFGQAGGDPMFQKAQNILNIAAAEREKGWNYADGNRTRYWLLENMQNNTLKEIRTVIFEYHRKGLDKMAEDLDAGRKGILTSLETLQKFHRNNPQAYILRVFCDTKKTELVDIFKKAPDDQKRQMLNIMTVVDPSNLNFYNRVNEK